jgi:hypothetical protein
MRGDQYKNCLTVRIRQSKHSKIEIERIGLRRGGAVVSTLAGLFCHRLRETRYGIRKRPYLFYMVLSHSRKGYNEVVWQQTNV